MTEVPWTVPWDNLKASQEYYYCSIKVQVENIVDGVKHLICISIRSLELCWGLSFFVFRG